MVAFDAAQSPHALEGRLVADVPTERVRRIGRVHDEAAGTNDLGRAIQQPQLRIDRMYLEVLAHNVILGLLWGGG